MSRLTEPSAKAPRKFYPAPCPTCGHPSAAINPAWLRWRRLAARVSQRDFAALVGVSGPYLSDIERGRRACPDSLRANYEGLPMP